MRIALCQLNSTMGDIQGNTRCMSEAIRAVAESEPDLVVFPELFVQGYPPRDLLERPSFVKQGLQALEEMLAVSRTYPAMGLLFGCAMPNNLPHGRGLNNSAVLVENGAILFHQNKSLLPTYDVFDERRYFDRAERIEVFEYKGETLGVLICEDAWNDSSLDAKRLYPVDPVEELVRQGATLLINVSGSPFHVDKAAVRHDIMGRHAARHGVPLVFVNQVGGNDELVFDGRSMVFGADGGMRTLLPAFEEAWELVDTREPGDTVTMPAVDPIADIHAALVLGVRDYLHKCGFSDAIIGLSGGIDSAVTAAIAVDALGAEHVTGVTMPSRYSSGGSVDDSEVLAGNLGIAFKRIAIEPMFASFLEALEPSFEGREPDVTEENLQARIRGTVLMGLANKFRALVLSTGNKSEMAVGYCTLYGDMNGGLSVISDLPKTTVYEVARYINRDREVIPEATITKAPSAELRPDQKDEDSLPPYDTLDAILRMVVQDGMSGEDAVAAGHDAEQVRWVLRAVAINEYKRRQAAPGIRVTPKAFGMGRRFPIAARYEL